MYLRPGGEHRNEKQHQGPEGRKGRAHRAWRALYRGPTPSKRGSTFGHVERCLRLHVVRPALPQGKLYIRARSGCRRSRGFAGTPAAEHSTPSSPAPPPLRRNSSRRTLVARGGVGLYQGSVGTTPPAGAANPTRVRGQAGAGWAIDNMDSPAGRADHGGGEARLSKLDFRWRHEFRGALVHPHPGRFRRPCLAMSVSFRQDRCPHRKTHTAGIFELVPRGHRTCSASG